MRNKRTDLNVDIQKETLNVLWDAAKAAETKRSTVDLLKNILTESEQLMLGRRLLIARMLLDGLPQTEIRYRFRLSPNTVWKVNRWLMEQIPEYGEALKKIDSESNGRNKKPSYHHYDPFSFYALKKKYPMHFLFFNLSEEILKKLKK